MIAYPELFSKSFSTFPRDTGRGPSRTRPLRGVYGGASREGVVRAENSGQKLAYPAHVHASVGGRIPRVSETGRCLEVLCVEPLWLCNDSRLVMPSC